MSVKLASVLCIGALAVIAAGCGGGGKKAASSTTAATTTTAAATTAAATTTAAPGFASTKNCVQLAELASRVAKSLQPTGTDLEATIANETKVLQAMVNAAPSEIRGDFQTFVSAFSQYAQELSKIGLKAGSVPTAAQVAQLVAAAKGFSTPKLQAAEKHLSAWAQKNCGGLTTTTTP